MQYQCTSTHLLIQKLTMQTPKHCEFCSKLTIMALETRYSRLYGGFIVNSEQFSSFILVFLLMNLNK